jgi:hypothetical protein
VLPPSKTTLTAPTEPTKTKPETLAVQLDESKERVTDDIVPTMEAQPPPETVEVPAQ